MRSRPPPLALGAAPFAQPPPRAVTIGHSWPMYSLAEATRANDGLDETLGPRVFAYAAAHPEVPYAGCYVDIPTGTFTIAVAGTTGARAQPSELV